MDDNSVARHAADAYVDLLERRDWPGLAALLADDVVYEMPQTRERIYGKDAFLRFNIEYPRRLAATSATSDRRWSACRPVA